MNPYPTLDIFVRSHARLVLPGSRSRAPRGDWRLVQDAPTGEIVGIHTLRGRAIATNGIMVAIENEYNVIHFGHYHWFICDDLDDQIKLIEAANPTRGTTKHFSNNEIEMLLE